VFDYEGVHFSVSVFRMDEIETHLIAFALNSEFCGTPFSQVSAATAIWRIA
jgi:hypothetical protein